MQDSYDVIIIGGGVVGSAVCRELTKYQVKVAVLEKNPDVVNEMSGRNSAVVHAGFSYQADTLKSKYTLLGCKEIEKASEDLGFDFIRCGKLLVGNTPDDYDRLVQTMEHGQALGVQGLEMVDQDQIQEILPHTKGKFALYSKLSGILDPFQYTISLAENAVANGARYFLKNKVIEIQDLGDRYQIKTDKGTFYARWIINSAGQGAVEVAKLMGLPGYPIQYTRGCYYVLDKKATPKMDVSLYPVPNPLYMGIHFTPTIDGNIIIGPDAEVIDRAGDYAVNRQSMEYLIEDSAKLWPRVSPKDFIRNYAGIQTTWSDEWTGKKDFLIEIDPISPRAIQMIGMESPALTCALPLSRHVVDLLGSHMDLKVNPAFNPIREKPVKFSKLSSEEKSALIQQDPNYGQIICRCEEVTKAEILAAAQNPLGADSMVSIKYRTRAMMGRCQGGYCLTKIAQIVQEVHDQTEEEVVHDRAGAYLFTGKVR